MKVLTRKQREYLEKLKIRNAKLAQLEPERWFSGLSNPMAPSERKMRQRIRKNCFAAIIDLSLVGLAGVMPDQACRKLGIGSVSDLLRGVNLQMIVRSGCLRKTREEASTFG